MHVLVIGSSLMDLFTSLEDCNDVKREGNAVTFDLGGKVPINIQALTLGGNGSNVSSGLNKLGISTAFYTFLGEDVLSSHIKDLLEREGVSLYVEPEKTTTGSLSVIFNFDTDRIIFSHHNVFPHTFDSSKIKEKPDVIFLTSIGKEWENAYTKVLSYAKEHQIPIAFSPGSQQMKDINEVFIAAMHQSSMLFCNMEEARKINKALSSEEIDNPHELLLNIKNNGFDLLSITDGEKGAYAVDKKNTVLKIDTLPPEGNEKTGAGDAYAAGFLGAYLRDKPIESCMKWGVLNAVGEMTYVGSRTGQLTLSDMEKKEQETTFSITTL